jgi:hypothetical protein
MVWLPTPQVRAERERASWRLHLVHHRVGLKEPGSTPQLNIQLERDVAQRIPAERRSLPPTATRILRRLEGRLELPQSELKASLLLNSKLRRGAGDGTRTRDIQLGRKGGREERGAYSEKALDADLAHFLTADFSL